jgi:hypothetical protein
MTEYVINPPTRAAVLTIAKAANLTRPATTGPRLEAIAEHVIEGEILSTGGSWVLNYVGREYRPTGVILDGPRGPYPEMAELPGMWARLRVNGKVPLRITNLIAKVREAGVSAYTLEPIGPNSSLVWTADGVTPGPDYIDTIALMS